MKSDFLVENICTHPQLRQRKPAFSDEFDEFVQYLCSSRHRPRDLRCEPFDTNKLFQELFICNRFQIKSI
jgi:hypothetical protein